MTEEIKQGWQCPNCKRINSPEVKTCVCTKAEDQTKDQKNLLLEG